MILVSASAFGDAKIIVHNIDVANADIASDFNLDVGNGTCLGTTTWYYGLDDNHGTNIDIVTIALHEFAHGLGFSGTFDSRTGALFEGLPDIFALHTLDDTLG